MDGYVEYYRKKYRIVKACDVLVNRNTPVGEDALFYERRPFGGRREFTPILKIKSGEVHSCMSGKMWKDGWKFYVEESLQAFLQDKGVHLPSKTLYDRTSMLLSRDS